MIYSMAGGGGETVKKCKAKFSKMPLKYTLFVNLIMHVFIYLFKKITKLIRKNYVRKNTILLIK